VIGFGVNYTTGLAIHRGTHRDGMEQPLKIWVPSIGISGMLFYTGDRFPQWKNNLFVGGMNGQQLSRLTLNGRQVVNEELLAQRMGRIRDIRQGPDGFIYLVTDDRDGKPTPILRVEPVGTPRHAVTGTWGPASAGPPMGRYVRQRRRGVDGRREVLREERQHVALDALPHLVGVVALVLLVVVRHVQARQRRVQLLVRPQQRILQADVDGDRVVAVQRARCAARPSRAARWPPTSPRSPAAPCRPSRGGRERAAGLAGFGDHAAADARLVDGPKPGAAAASTACSRVLIASDAAMPSAAGCGWR
jgi:hypothetical protein